LQTELLSKYIFLENTKCKHLKKCSWSYRLPVIMLCLCIAFSGHSQTLSFIKTKSLTCDTTPVRFAPAFVSPFNFKVYHASKSLLSDTCYKVDYAKATILFLPALLGDTVTVTYNLLNSPLYSNYAHKPLSLIIHDSIPRQTTSRIYIPEASENFEDDLLKRGSISRGINIGNNQNASVTSSLNLQISGKIGNDIQIVAALTDNQVPFQPNGNTQQINDFDKIFITVFNKRHKLTLGDYDLVSHDNSFISLTRKAQGVQYTYKPANDSTGMQIEANASVSKGKYNRMSFNGSEGVQGPYKLTGSNNEPFIVIIAGTERIFIDGKQLLRGENNDYIMNYNTAELSFTAKNPITKDSRIVVEFEYSEQNYVRFLTFEKVSYKTKKSTYSIQFFDEFDSKNQPLQQTLSDTDKHVLAAAGNDEWKAVVPFYTVDTVRNENSIYYRMTDTLVNGMVYDSIFVYSTDSADKYRVGFTYVNKGNGNYILSSSNANGRVFKWIAPVNGTKQGDYEPIRKLVAPMRKTVAIIGYQFHLNKKTNLSVEMGLSDVNNNTLSSVGHQNNTGFANKTLFEQKFFNNDSAKNRFMYELHFQYVNKTFQTPERFKSVEFNRDWNYNSTTLQSDEWMGGVDAQYQYKHWLKSTFGADILKNKNYFDGIKYHGLASVENKTWTLLHQASYLTTQQSTHNTKFFRYSSKNEKRIYKFKTGLLLDMEDNLWEKSHSDSLLASSYKYYRWDGYVGNVDTTKIGWLARFSQRNDFAPIQNKLSPAYNSNEASIESHVQQFKHVQLNAFLTYRQVQSQKDTAKNKDQNLTSKIDGMLRVAKNAITLTASHESNAGIEPKLIYSYIEVPPGQGVYTWIDYNHNGIKELNEFETTQFSDQATYIRIASPTTDYIKVYGSRLSQTLNLRPDIVWGNKNGIRKFISLFSNQLAWQSELKTTSSDWIKRFLPISSDDTSQLLMNTLIRNTFSINRTNTHWGIDYIYQKNNNAQLLINGTDKRNMESHTLHGRWNINEWVSIYVSPCIGTKQYNSAYLITQNYNIHYTTIEGNVQYQPNANMRITNTLKDTKKLDKLSSQKADMLTYSLELRKNIKENNFMQIKIDIVKNTYKGSMNNSLSYEILEGLQPGWNQIYTLQLQRNISSVLQMVLSYQGRVSKGSKMIHTGSVEMRAFF